MVTWREMIEESMKALGGHAKYSDLYDEIKVRYKERVESVVDYKAQVRGTIEGFSSYSEVYQKKNKNREASKKTDDVFYMVGEKGDGHWGLRNFEPHDNEVDITDDDEGFPEGKQKLRLHVCRERNYRVIQEAKELHKKINGKLKCQICDFDFEEFYGKLGVDFIEGHHIKPVSELKDGDKTKVEDILLVCSNCHRMLHRKRPWLGPNDLKSLLKNR